MNDEGININIKDSLDNKYTPWFLIAILIIVIILMKQCDGVKKVEDFVCNCDESYYELRTVYRDTGSVEKIYIPERDTLFDTVLLDRFITIPQEVDTQAIIEDYFRVYTCRDSFLANDIKAYLYDTIGMNRILSRKWELQNLRETSIIQPIKKPKFQVYVGMGLSSRHKLPIRADINPSLAFKTKTDLLLTFNYGVFENRIQATVYYKIKFRK